MDKVYEHKIVILFNKNENTAKTTEYNVLGENERYFVVDNSIFSTYQKKKDKSFNMYSSLEEISVIDWSGDRYLNQIIITMISEEACFSKIKKKLSKKFDKWLYEKHGRFISMYGDISKMIEMLDVSE